jgi:hypothetical protein
LNFDLFGRKFKFVGIAMATEGDDPISEDDCLVCRGWPAADRLSMRALIDRMPMGDLDQVCDGCVRAFWTNCVVDRKSRGLKPTKH